MNQRYQFWCGLLLSLALAQAFPCSAQLSVLSSGNPEDQWKSTQLQLIEQQLGDQSVKGELRKELEAQKQWLSQWNPGTLKQTPAIKPRETSKQLIEPILDPNKKASKLRERLLGKNAKPTAKDTAELQKLLDSSPEDLGVQQLYLHWIDQRQYRNEYAQRIVDSANKLAGALLAIEEKKEPERLVLAFSYYRAARALIHMESSEMKSKQLIQDAQKHEADLLGLHSQINELVGYGKPEFILVSIRMLQRDQWNGQALLLLEENAQRLDNVWYLNRRRDLLRELGWTQPAKEAEEIAASATDTVR